MAANATQLDLLSSAFVKSSASKAGFNQAKQDLPAKDKRESDSFKSVIARNENSTTSRNEKIAKKDEENQRAKAVDKSADSNTVQRKESESGVKADGQERPAANGEGEQNSSRESTSKNNTHNGTDSSEDDPRLIVEGNPIAAEQEKLVEGALQLGLPLGLDPSVAAIPGQEGGEILPLAVTTEDANLELSDAELTEIQQQVQEQSAGLIGTGAQPGVASNGEQNLSAVNDSTGQKLKLKTPTNIKLSADPDSRVWDESQQQTVKLADAATSSTGNGAEAKQVNAVANELVQTSAISGERMSTPKLRDDQQGESINLGLNNDEPEGLNLASKARNLFEAITTLASKTLSKQSADTIDAAKSIDSDSIAPLSRSANPILENTWAQHFQTMNNLGAAQKTGELQLQLPLNVKNPEWFGAVADRVSWLASQNIRAADIQLDPPELGPLQVRITVNHDQASVNFVSHQASVRETLDSQLMRLRELFSNEGMNLVDVNVSDRHQQQNQQQEQQLDSSIGPSSGVEADSAISNVPVTEIKNWVDYYV